MKCLTVWSLFTKLFDKNATYYSNGTGHKMVNLKWRSQWQKDWTWIRSSIDGHSQISLATNPWVVRASTICSLTRIPEGVKCKFPTLKSWYLWKILTTQMSDLGLILLLLNVNKAFSNLHPEHYQGKVESKMLRCRAGINCLPTPSRLSRESCLWVIPNTAKPMKAFLLLHPPHHDSFD